jgi:hypothetical protein
MNSITDSTVISVANGNWNEPSTWNIGVVPSAVSKVFVRHNVTVTADASAYSLTVEPAAGNIIVQTGITLTVAH